MNKYTNQWSAPYDENVDQGRISDEAYQRYIDMKGDIND